MAFYSKYVFQKIEFYLRTIEYNKCCNSILRWRHSAFSVNQEQPIKHRNMDALINEAPN